MILLLLLTCKIYNSINLLITFTDSKRRKLENLLLYFITSKKKSKNGVTDPLITIGQ